MREKAVWGSYRIVHKISLHNASLVCLFVWVAGKPDGFGEGR